MAKKILIIEDNSLNMNLFRKLLENSGYEVLQAEDGFAGFELAKKHHPDLAIIDVRLPEISGFEVARMIKENTGSRNIPIIAITAYPINQIKQACLESNCDDYIAKPILPSAFLDTVAKNISRPLAAADGP